MSGASVKIPAAWLDSDRIEDLDAGTVLLMLGALGWSAEQTTDGLVPRRQLRKLWPVDDVAAAVDQLIKAGEVEDHGDRILLTHWRDFILPADEVDEIREKNRVRTERSRRHQRGDHSMCLPSYCRAAASQSRDGSRHESRDSDGTARVSDALPIRTAPTRTDPTPREGRKGRAEAPSGSAGAPPTGGPATAKNKPPQHPFHAGPNGDKLRCSECGHPRHPIERHDFPYDLCDPKDVHPENGLPDDHPCPICGLGIRHIAHAAHAFDGTGDRCDGEIDGCGERREHLIHTWTSTPDVHEIES